MKRKRLLTWVGSIGFILVLASLSLMAACVAAPPTTAPAPELEKEPWELMEPTIWRYQSCNVLGSIDTLNVELFKEEIEAKTHGRLKIEIYPVGGLGYPVSKTISATRDGLLQIGEHLGFLCHGEYYISDIGDFWGLVPPNLEAQTMAAEALYPFFEKTLPSRYNQYFLDLWFADPKGPFTTDKKVETLDDLKGLKIRAGGPYLTNLVKAMGASPVALSSPEMYEALARGTVDGIITSPCWCYDNKIYEVAKYFYYTKTGFTQIFYTVNKDALNALPPTVQEWVVDTWRSCCQKVRGREFETVATKVKGLIDNGMVCVEVSPADMEKIKELTEPFIAEYVEGGGLVAKEAMKALKAAVAE